MNTYRIDTTYTCHVLLTIKARNRTEALKIASQGSLSHDQIINAEDGSYEDLVSVNQEDTDEVCNKHPAVWIDHNVQCPICTHESNLQLYEEARQ